MSLTPGFAGSKKFGSTTKVEAPGLDKAVVRE